MSEARERAITYAQENREQFLTELKEILRIPSISTDPAYEDEMQNAAEWIKNKLEDIGMSNVQIMPTKGIPVVYAENMAAGSDAVTMMVYGHYDVQPADPEDLWESEAFEPEERDGNLYGRGTSDMKGQMMASIYALQAAFEQGNLPINIKFMIEGEEENTSPNLESFMKENKELLSCDFVLNPDAGMADVDLPTITYGMRGLLSLEIHVKGPDHDLHSGLYGGAVRNPIHELSRLVGGMHDENGRIMLPGFYDKVMDVDITEREALAKLPIDEEEVLNEVGAPDLWGEKGYSFVERVGARPALDINGIYGGYTGAGSKTVLPSEAHAKLTMRLVPDQDPNEALEQLKQYLDNNIYSSNTWEIEFRDGAAATITDRDSKEVQAMETALETAWEKDAVYFRSGGSIPAIGYMQDVLEAESILTGFSRPDDNIHAPNEKIHLETLYKGVDSLIHFLFNLEDIYAG